ncbi:MAG: glycosyltransferase [Desulfurellales bacterium]|uniref:glycosyltransferase n=1 Tax=Pseudoxanthomonas mexicana TaxID=128785 RepID=UPI0011D98C60|nr:glycosyltransferase [Pseudoxanthomonas mexicana]TXH58542.1 MAG: glycosyltransferase [Desulfurellales bacterium]
MTLPKVSVIMPTFNHELFVKEAIESVLSQEGVDLELIVADDGSSDSTRDRVAEVRDERIRFFPNEVNRGACVVTNELIERASGEYIALINSDDAWMPGKLEFQLDILETNKELAASFGRAEYMDRDGKLVPKESLQFGGVFDVENRSSGQWLRRFFAEGNCLCHPTMLIRRDVYSSVGKYSNRLRQLPDFDMWIRVVKNYEIHVADKELIKFRMLPGENVSGHNRVNSVRTLNEHFLIADDFFEGVSRESMIDGFSDILVFKDVPTKEHLDIEKVLLFFHENMWLWRPYKMIGLLKMRALLDSDSHRDVLQSSYGVSDRWFHDQMGRVDAIAPAVIPLDSFSHHANSMLRALKRRFSN